MKSCLEKYQLVSVIYSSTRARETMETLSFNTFMLVLEMFHCG